MTMTDPNTTESLARMNDAIHTLAQPLTALSFTVEMGLLKATPESWRAALEQASNETQRAILALEDIRAAALILSNMDATEKDYGGLPWKQRG